ncbi:transposase [Hymenobacter sp. BT770]|uniref:transposase n=1 Tax=Hymenobacter sp. BT770 TaxID=2886942 RepID=UPI001D12BD43|nr:transposase [Hymenobacter sp. BT770]MCC3153154.1 transposase [Hymenobacter sp. BT770]MDO3415372.1 transposase [Hymenobacter sp. BT770]
MSDLIYYERNLPHWLPPGELIFITFRLSGSLPQEVLERLQDEARLLQQGCGLDPAAQYAEQKKYFGRFDALLDGTDHGPTWLRQPEVAAIVAQSLHYPDGKGYNLRCYCIMPNHVHLVVELPVEAPPLAKTLQLLKGYSSRQANRLLGLSGTFWQAESYDHVVRPGELERIINYVVENPVKAGLVDDWEKWPYTFIAKQ